VVGGEVKRIGEAGATGRMGGGGWSRRMEAGGEGGRLEGVEGVGGRGEGGVRERGGGGGGGWRSVEDQIRGYVVGESRGMEERRG